ncbi:MAG TPA: DUF2780 domain-containing protein [Steroidobacteraceae bacterium]|jgi:hypothetical protein|nr:DUF2780 domain-containing protein [Steroidobacteraceae bacterium]
MQRRKLLFALVLTLPFVGSASAGDPLDTDSLMSTAKSAASGSLTGLLSGQLGVTQNQAEGGVGSMLKLAQEKLSAGDFDMVAKAVPGAQKYLDKAKNLGAYAGSVNNAAGLNGALAKLGIPPETSAKFMPMVTNYVSKVGGPKVGALLKSALAS